METSRRDQNRDLISIRSHGSEKEKVGLVVREWFLLGNHP